MIFFTLLSTVSATCLVNAIGWEKCPNDKYWAYPTELFVISRKCSRSSLLCELQLAPKRNGHDETVCTKTYTIQLSDMCESLLLPGYFMRYHRRKSLGKKLRIKDTMAVTNSTTDCNEDKIKRHFNNEVDYVPSIKEDMLGFELYNDCAYRDNWSWSMIEQYFGGHIFED